MAERENMRCDFDLIIDEICRRLKAENSLRKAEQKSTFSEAEILRLQKKIGEVKSRNIDLHNDYVLLKTQYERLAQKYDTLKGLYDDKCSECKSHKDKRASAERWIKAMKNKEGENNAKYVYCAVDEKDEIQWVGEKLLFKFRSAFLEDMVEIYNRSCPNNPCRIVKYKLIEVKE